MVIMVACIVTHVQAINAAVSNERQQAERGQHAKQLRARRLPSHLLHAQAHWHRCIAPHCLLGVHAPFA